MNESSSALAAYNSLADPVMSGYFGSDRIRKYLVKQGLITKDGLIISESAYRDRFARESRTKHTSDKLARSIVHQALDEERAHQMAIRDKLDEISRLEHVRRLRAERELRKAVQSEHSRSETEWAVQSSKRPATGSGLQQRKKQQPNRLRPKSAPRRKFVTELELAEKSRHGNEVVIEEADSGSKDGQSPASKPEPADRSAVTTPRKSSHSSLRSTSLDDHFKRPRTPPEEHNRRGSTSRSRSPSPSRSRSPPSHSSRSKSPSPQRSRSRSRSHSRSPSPALARPRSRSVSQPVSRSADGRKSKRSAPQTAQDAKAKESRRPRTAKTASSSRVVVEKEAYLEYKRTLRQLLGGPRCIGFIPKPPNQKREGNTRVALRRHARRPDSAKRQQSGNEKPRGRSQDRRRASLPNGSSSPRATSRLPRSLERLKSFCKLTFRFNGLRKKQSESGEKRENASANEKHMISVEQQHCGGNTLEVFRGQLCPNSELEFMSQRHRGYPLGLTIYVDGACDFRISQCCESKRKVGTQFGQFTLVSVANAQPCYRCRLDRQEAEKRKKKLNGDKDGEEADKAQSEEGDKHQNANEGDKAKRSRSHENSYSSDAFEDEDDGSKKDHEKSKPMRLNISNVTMTVRGDESVQRMITKNGKPKSKSKKHSKQSSEVTLTLSGNLVLDAADRSDSRKLQTKRKSKTTVAGERPKSSASRSTESKHVHGKKDKHDSQSPRDADRADVDTLSMVSEIRSEQVTPSPRGAQRSGSPSSRTRTTESPSVSANRAGYSTSSKSRTQSPPDEYSDDESSDNDRSTSRRPLTDTARSDDEQPSSARKADYHDDFDDTAADDAAALGPLVLAADPDNNAKAKPSAVSNATQSPTARSNTSVERLDNAQVHNASAQFNKSPTRSPARDSQSSLDYTVNASQDQHDDAAFFSADESNADPALQQRPDSTQSQRSRASANERQNAAADQSDGNSTQRSVDRLVIADENDAEVQIAQKAADPDAASPRNSLDNTPGVIAIPIDKKPDSVIVEIDSVVFAQHASFLQNPDITKVFVTYHFLNIPTEEVETPPHSLPKSSETSEPIDFSFRKEFYVDRESNFRRRQHLASMLQPDGNQTVPFYVTSELDDESGDCEDVAMAKVNLRELLISGTDLKNKPIPLFDPANDSNEIGTLYLTIQAVDVLKAIASEFSVSLDKPAAVSSSTVSLTDSAKALKPRVLGESPAASADSKKLDVGQADEDSDAETLNKKQSAAPWDKTRRNRTGSESGASSDEGEDRQNAAVIANKATGGRHRPVVTFRHEVEERIRTATETDASEYSTGGAGTPSESDSEIDLPESNKDTAAKREQSSASVNQTAQDSAAALQAIRSAPLPIVQSPSAKQPEDSQLTPKKNVQVEQDSDADNEPEAEADSQTKAFENETEALENARDEQAESPAPSDGQSALAGKNLPSRGSGSLSSQGSLSTPKDSAAVKATTSNADNEQLSDDEEDVSDGGAEDEGNREMKDARTVQNVTLKNNDSISSSNLQSLLTAFQANTSLESLVFASLSALNDDILAEILQSVSRQSILRTIGISDCVKLTSKCGQVLAKSLSKFANLETIGISGVSLGDAGVKELTGAIVKQFSGDDDQSANIYGSFGLRSLSLSNCDIGDDGVLSVVELIRCDSPIDTLHLVGCSASVSVETWSQFGQAVAENTELASLNLSNCMLTGEKLRTICENLQMNRSVQRLDIRSNLCTADCGKYLLELAKNSSTLKFIECDFGNDFDDETLEEIERILRRKAAGRLDN